MTSGVSSKLHYCWTVFSCLVSRFQPSRSRQRISGAGSELVSRDSQGAASSEAPGSLLGLQPKGGSGCSTESVIPLCQELSLKPHKLLDDENQKARCVCRYSLSPPAGVIPNVPSSNLFSRGGSTKGRDMISKS